MKNYLCTLLLLCLSLVATAQQRKNAAYISYIQTYKDLAIEQMRRYHIPASITLAQGLFESGAGQSELARRSNNHFGIKCGSSWRGRTTHHSDDRPNECFRVYSRVADSYEDHSAFLMKERYRRLFSLDPLDYKGWARGLKACGYATLPTYADRLISVIELYDLHQYDEDAYGKRKVVKETPAVEAVPVYMAHKLRTVNDIACVTCVEGDSWKSLAKELKSRGFSISWRKLIKYNEAEKNYFPPAGTNIFLAKKAKRADKTKYSKEYWHRVKRGESMYTISQFYGIRLKNLYKLNYRPLDYLPEEGDLLKVR